MGIFQQRPEEPTEWAGLPSDPWEPRSPSEILPPPVEGADLLGATSVTIEVPLDLPSADTSEA